MPSRLDLPPSGSSKAFEQPISRIVRRDCAVEVDQDMPVGVPVRSHLRTGSARLGWSPKRRWKRVQSPSVEIPIYLYVAIHTLPSDAIATRRRIRVFHATRGLNQECSVSHGDASVFAVVLTQQNYNWRQEEPLANLVSREVMRARLVSFESR